MKHRIETLLEEEDATVPTTKSIALQIKRCISRITVQMKGLNSTHIPTAHPARMVSKIEVVDGSYVLYSLSGIEVQAQDYYDEGKMPTEALMYINDVYAIATYNLNFGRFLWDEERALDPSKFSNLQLKITHNKALGGSLPDGGKLSAFAYVFDNETIHPAGYLRHVEVYDWTLAPSAWQGIDLPVDHPIRRLTVQSLHPGKQAWENVNRITINQNGGEAKAVDNMRTSDIIKLYYPGLEDSEKINVYDIDAETTIYCTMTQWNSVVGNGLNANEVTLFSDESYGGAFDATAGAAGAVQFIALGQVPHGAIAIPFGDQTDISDWYLMDGVEHLRLEVTAGAAAVGTAQVIVQQDCLYSTIPRR